MVSIFIRTIIIYVLLSIMLKLMGKRQIGELEISELVSTLLISEIAAIPISDSNLPLLTAIIPIVFISTLEILISALKNRWHGLKRVVEGKPVYIIYKGRLLQSELDKNRISINEVLTEMRTQDIGNINDIYYAVLEQNGKLSLLTKDDSKSFAHPIILDTVIDREALMRLGYDEEWLNAALKDKNLKAEDVFLLTITDKGKIEVIERNQK